MKNKTITLNNITDILKNIARDHIMIKDYGYGDLGSGKFNLKMPYLWIQPLSQSTINDNNTQQAVYSIDIFVCDRITKGDDNSEEIISDTNFILNWILSYFKTSKEIKNMGIKITNNDLEIFTSKTDNNLNGWVVNVKFRIPINYSACDGLLEICPDCEC